MSDTTQLPDFEMPPVVEVAMSLQFKALEGLRSSHIGLFWEVLRAKGFRRTEDHGELEPALEEYSATPLPKVGIRIQTFDDAPPLPRAWFLNEEQNELVQIQRDRLIVNWRQGAEQEPYPRYDSIRASFIASFEAFRGFVRDEGIGEITPNQCELTYVNQIVPAGGIWQRHGNLDRVVTVWQNSYSDPYLSMPEEAEFRTRYRMNDANGNPLGRLYITLQPAYRNTDSTPIFVLNITGRGGPVSPDLDSSLSLFDMEHVWIVRGFAAITDPTMHKIWRRKDVR